MLLALTAIGLVTALVIAAWQFGERRRAARPRAELDAGRDQCGAHRTRRGSVRLELKATRGDSYLIVRSGGAAGDLLYEGTLERGQRKFFDDKVLWLRLETPANVLAKRNGNRVKFLPAVKAQGVFVTAKKIFAADAS